MKLNEAPQLSHHHEMNHRVTEMPAEKILVEQKCGGDSSRTPVSLQSSWSALDVSRLPPKNDDLGAAV